MQKPDKPSTPDVPPNPLVPTVSAGDAHRNFDAQPPVSVVEVDRFCLGCGYNLRHSHIRRDPATQLLLCRCPECGGFHPANELAATTRAWAKHLLVGVAILWVFFWLGLVGMSMVGWGGIVAVGQDLARGWEYVEVQRPMAFDAQGTPTHWQADHDYRQVIRPWDEERLIATGVLGIAAILLGFVLVTLWVSAFAHWKRWGYIVFALMWMLIPLGIFVIAMIDRMQHRADVDPISAWRWVWLIVCLLLVQAGGFAGVWLGRPTARLAVRLLVPRTWRVGLSYLWLVDGKPLPNMDPLGNSD